MDKAVDMIWVDIETTGLEAGTDKILEIGVVLTDRFGNWIAGDSWLVGDETYHAPIEVARLHEIVGPMHTENGLFKEWERARLHYSARMAPEEREKDILSFLDNQNAEKGKHPMAGATVHFDRKMIAAQMPELEAFFHYRNFDISTIKQAARWLNPDCAEAPVEEYTDLTPHRGMDDCVREIQEYRYYIDNFLFTTQAEPES